LGRSQHLTATATGFMQAITAQLLPLDSPRRGHLDSHRITTIAPIAQLKPIKLPIDIKILCNLNQDSESVCDQARFCPGGGVNLLEHGKSDR
jgi:hypothetical protein